MEEKWSIGTERSKLDDLEVSVAPLFNGKRIVEYVDGAAVLAEGASAEAREKFKSEQQKAFSIVVMSVSSPLLYLITSCELPKDAWDTLKRHFERDTLPISYSSRNNILERQCVREPQSIHTSKK